MWRYSSIMAADFRATSSSVKAGFGRGGGFVLLLYFAAGKRREKKLHFFSLYVQLRQPK